MDLVKKVRNLDMNFWCIGIYVSCGGRGMVYKKYFYKKSLTGIDT